MWVTQDLKADLTRKIFFPIQRADMFLLVPRLSILLVFKMQIVSTQGNHDCVNKVALHHEAFRTILLPKDRYPSTIEAADISDYKVADPSPEEHAYLVPDKFGVQITPFIPITLPCHVCGYANINPATGKCDRCGQ